MSFISNLINDIPSFIMEDFVPYELAVKLEQKGFKQGYNIFGYRPIFSDETTIRFISDIGAYENEYFGENIAAPTISQVLKWLRENNKLHISTKPYPCEDGVMWEYGIRSFSPVLVCVIVNKTGFQKPEQAALAGIEHVIDNLI